MASNRSLFFSGSVPVMALVIFQCNGPTILAQRVRVAATLLFGLNVQALEQMKLVFYLPILSRDDSFLSFPLFFLTDS